MTEPYELGKAPNIGPMWALTRSVLDEVGGVRMKEGGFSVNIVSFLCINLYLILVDP